MTGKKLGISDETVSASVDILNAILADDCLLLLKTVKAHWDIRGAQSHGLHDLWLGQAVSLSALINSVGERVRTLGAYPVSTAAGMIGKSALVEDNRPFTNARDAVDALCADHESVCRAIRLDTQNAGPGVEDVVTVDLLTRALELHEQCAGALRVFVDGVAVKGGRGH